MPVFTESETHGYKIVTHSNVCIIKRNKMAEFRQNYRIISIVNSDSKRVTANKLVSYYIIPSSANIKGEVGVVVLL